MSVDDVASAIASGDQVVDVRTTEEYASGHIPGSRLIPLFAIPLRTSELDRNRRIFVVCQSGARATQACQYLAGQGYDVRVLEGGMAAWQSAGMPVTAGQPSFG